MADSERDSPVQKVGIVTDSIACLPPEVLRQYRVRVVPLNICFDGKVYRDGLDLTASQAYELLAKAPDLFATSPGSAGDYLEAYRELSSQFPAIVCIALSSRLSTLYDMACVALKQAREEFPGTTIEVLDSRNASVWETMIALTAARAAAEGRDLAEVIKTAEAVRDRVDVIGVFETIRHVYRTGRIPKFASQMLSTLNIKPLFAISGGTVHITSVDTDKERGVRRLLKIMKERVGTSPVHVAVSHANVPDEGERLRDRISSQFNCVELLLTDFSPIMGYATGQGTLLIAFYGED